MERRIYFAFPEPRQARSAVNELLAAGIARTDIHAVARSSELKAMKRATSRANLARDYHAGC